MRAKVDAGADFIVTQMFYDYDTFERWVRDLRGAGITIPILPGIMPIQGWQSFQKTTSFSKTIVPQEFWDRLEAVKDDDQRVREVGTELVAGLCRRILESDLGIHSLHFYTMNLERGTAMLLEKLQMVAQVDVVNPLPWRPVRGRPSCSLTSQSLTAKRRAESTRPIHWSNRPGSYLARTESWGPSAISNAKLTSQTSSRTAAGATRAVRRTASSTATASTSSSACVGAFMTVLIPTARPGAPDVGRAADRR